MTTEHEGQEYREGDTVVVQSGASRGMTGKVTGVLPTLGTVRGNESIYVYKTDISSEHFRGKDLGRSG